MAHRNQRNPRLSVARIDSRQKAADALRYRTMGLSWEQVARKTGYSGKASCGVQVQGCGVDQRRCVTGSTVIAMSSIVF
jgi:hypothetical protein